MFTHITRHATSYPQKLLELIDPPQQLFARGSLEVLTAPCIGIVGSRKMTSYGKRVLSSIVPEFVRYGCTIVSGLAFGVDVEAHTVTLREHGKAVAVLGSGIELITPRAHEQIGTAITKQGLLLSEYPDSTPGHKSQFPARNRIIAGLSDILIIIEGSMRSGSLITADFMMQLGRNVFAVPGNIDAPVSMGCNFLIQNGAHPLLTAQDALETLGFDKHTPPPVSSDVSPEEKKLLALLGENQYTIDELQQKLDIPINELLHLLTGLEVQNIITTSSDGTLILNR